MRKNYAVALREFGRFEEALFHLNIVCGMQPDNISVLWDRADTYLHLGRFKEGWESYKVRLKGPEMKDRAASAPLWNGEPLKGKTILIYPEQGFGGTILCSRYIPMVKMRGGRIILECKEPLQRLFSKIPGIDLIVSSGHSEQDFDYHTPIMALPGIFNTDLNSIPPLPDFFVPDSPPEGAKRLLDLAKGRFKIGIVWSGSITFKNNKKRAVSVERFLPFAQVPGVQLYSLQKGPRESDLRACGGQGLVLDMAPYMNDFADTASILNELDLVIMTDSSVAHLAGSIGTPIWNMLCYQSYWLYLSERSDSPWYPSMRFFRQPEPGNWDAVFKKVITELETAVALKQSGSWGISNLRRKISG